MGDIECPCVTLVLERVFSLGVLTLEGGVRQTVTMDVMPLTGGFLPLPSVRLSKYIPADIKQNVPRGELLMCLC